MKMEDRSLNGNRTAFQGSGLLGEITLMKWPSSGLPVYLGITIELAKSPAEKTWCRDVLLNQCTQVQPVAGGGQKTGLLRNGHAEHPAALVTVHRMPCATSAAASCGQFLLERTHSRLSAQPPTASSLWVGFLALVFWLYQRHGISK